MREMAGRERKQKSCELPLLIPNWAIVMITCSLGLTSCL